MSYSYFSLGIRIKNPWARPIKKNTRRRFRVKILNKIKSFTPWYVRVIYNEDLYTYNKYRSINIYIYIYLILLEMDTFNALTLK